MATYLILCADTVGQHQHVTTVMASKWRTDKGGYAPAEALDCLDVAARIREDDRFFVAVPRDDGEGVRTAEVRVTQCRLCREPTIRMVGENPLRDNLDFMPCG